MTIDITTLGLAVDTSDLKKGEAAMRAAEQAGNRLADAADKAAEASGRLSEKGKRTAEAIKGTESAARGAASAANQYGGAMNKVLAQAQQQFEAMRRATEGSTAASQAQAGAAREIEKALAALNATVATELRLAKESAKAAIDKANALAAEVTAMRNAAKASDDHAKASDRANESGKRQGAALGGVTASLGMYAKAIAAALSMQKLLAAADEWTNLNNRLKLVTSGSKAFGEAQEAILRIANNSRQSVSATAELYQRLAMNQDALGLSGQRMAGIVETISKTMVISGTSAAGAQAALVQLGQAFASGTLRGEELNSVLEQAPALAQAIAKGLGTTTGELRKLGEEGKLTTQQLIAALEGQANAVNEQFGKMDMTVGQSMTLLNNKFVEFVGRMDESTGASKALAGGIAGIADNMAPVITAIGTIMAFALASYLGGVATAAGGVATALGLATAAVRGFLVAAGPIGWLVAAIGGAAVAYQVLRDKAAASGDAIVDASNKGAQASAISTAQITGDINKLIGGYDALIKAKSKALGSGDVNLIDLEKQYAQQVKVQTDVANLYQQAMTRTGAYAKATAEQARAAMAGLEKDLGARTRAMSELDGKVREARKLSVQEYLSDTKRMGDAEQKAAAITKARAAADQALASAQGDAAAQTQIRARLATEIAKIEEAGEKRATAGIARAAKQRQAADDELAAMRAKIEAEEKLARQLEVTGDATAKLNEGEKLALKYAELMAVATDAKARAHLAEKKALAEKLGSLQRANEETERSNKEHEKYVASLHDSAAKINAQAVALEDEVRMYGLSKAAIEEVIIAREEERRAALAALGAGADVLAGIDAEIEARKRLAAAIRDKDAVEDTAKAAKQASDDWNKAADDINKSLTDALLRGFESGKGFGENLVDTLKNMFKTLVLRPVISAVMQPVAGGIQSMLGMGSQSGVGGVGGAINLLSGARNVYTALQGGVSLPGFMATPLAEMAGGDTLGNLIALKGAGTGGATPGIAGVSGAMNAAAGIGGGYMLGSAISGQYNAIGGSQAWASGGGAAIGAAIGSVVPVIGTVVGGLIGGALGGVVNRAFGMGPKEYGHRGFEGTVTSGGFDGQNFADWKQKGGWFRSNRGGTEYSAIDQPVLDKLNSGFDAMVGTLKGLRSAAGEPAFNNSLNDFRYGMRNDWSSPENFTKSMTDLSDALSRHLFPGLDGLRKEGESLLDTAVRLTGVFKTTSSTAEILGKDIDTAFGGFGMNGAGARQHMVDFAGGVDNLGAITSAYMDTVYSDSEKVAYAQKNLTEQFNALGFSLPKTTAELRGWIEQQDLATAGEAEHAVALMALTPAFAQLEQAMQSLGQTAVEVRSGIAELEDILLTDEQKYQNRFKAMQKELDDLGIGSLKTRDQLLDFARSLDRNTEAGEAAYQSLVRVAPTFLEVAAAAEAAAAKTKELTDNYFSLFKSPTEQLARTREQLAAEFGKLGQALPTSASAYTQLVDSIDTSTEANRKLKEQLMALAGPMNGFLQQLEQLGQQAGTGLQDILRQQMVLLEAQRNKVNSLIAEAQAALQLRGNARSLLSQIGGALGQTQGTAGRKEQLWGMLGSGITPQQQLDIASELMGLITQTATVDTSAAQELMSGAQASASAANSLLSAANALTESGRRLRDYVDSLKTGQLSPLTMGEKLAEAGRQYQATLAAAQGGDQTAIGNLQGAASAYLELARTYYASSDQYTAIFNQVTGAVDALGAGLMGQGSSQAAAAQAQLAAANQQITVAQGQLDQAKAQTGLSQAQIAELTRLQAFVQGIESAADANYQDLTGKLGTELGVLQAMEKALGLQSTVPGMLAALPAELAAALQPLINTVSGGAKYANDLYQQYLGRPGDTAGVNYWAQQFAEGTRTVDDFAWGAYQEQVKKAYKDVMDREADASGLDYYTRQMQAGRPLSEIIKDMQYAKLTGAYADGGYAPQGLALVGENGPEIVDFQAPGRVYTSDQLSAALSRFSAPQVMQYGRGDASQQLLVAEIRRLNEQVADLKATVQRVGDQDVATQVAVGNHVASAAKEGTKEAAQVAQTRKAPIV